MEKIYGIVKYVQRLYGNKVKKGYESDRGRVYLNMELPTKLRRANTNHLHTLMKYGNIMWLEIRPTKICFYNPTLVGNDYILLHSDVRGEVYDKNWERRLSSRNNSMYNFNATQSDDQYGGRAGENFNK
jgi:hypothetical protein